MSRKGVKLLDRMKQAIDLARAANGEPPAPRKKITVCKTPKRKKK